MQQVVTDRPEQMFAWVRQQDGNNVLGLFNFSAEPVEATLLDGLAAGSYREFRGADGVIFREGDTVQLPAWGFRLFSSREE